MREQDMVSIDSAENFLWLNARLLERLRFDHLFRGGDPRRVMDALRPYRNADGGFTWAVEGGDRALGSDRGEHRSR